MQAPRRCRAIATHRALERGCSRTPYRRGGSIRRAGTYWDRALAGATPASFISNARVGPLHWAAMHCGDPTHLCAWCLDDLFTSELDAVRARGKAWADELAGSVPGIDWPTGSEGLAIVARLKVTDLGRDPRLLERLARELLDAAHTRWLSRMS